MKIEESFTKVSNSNWILLFALGMNERGSLFFGEREI
jgi:hypothetical protein